MTNDEIKAQRDWLDGLTGYTEGDWRIGRLESYEMDGTPFRRVYFPGDDPCEAHVRGQDCDENARLIAAAPDLRDRYAAALDEIERLRVVLSDTADALDLANALLRQKPVTYAIPLTNQFNARHAAADLARATLKGDDQ